MALAAERGRHPQPFDVQPAPPQPAQQAAVDLPAVVAEPAGEYVQVGVADAGGLGGRRAAPERSAFFGEEFRQVGVAEIDAGLREQGGDLPAMVNLVQEQVQHQSTQVLAVGTAREIPVGQGLGQVFFPHFRAPVADQLIHPVPGGVEFRQVDKADFPQAGRIADHQDGFEGPVAARVSREALQPQDVADQDVVQGPDHRAEKGAPVFPLERFRHFRRRRVEALVHQPVVMTQQYELGFFAHGWAFDATGGVCPPGNADVVRGLLDPRRVLIWSDTVFWPRSVS